jgi:hypothetical protein
MSTATLSDNTPLGPDDELLVAYLDGELDRNRQTELENRLLDDEQLRKRLQQLQTGWDLLDDLPDPAPSLKLVESTLELVVADIVKEAPATSSLWTRYRMPICVAAICLIGVLGAFGLASMLKSREYRQQLNDLAIVEHLDAYDHGGDIELMHLLMANGDWSKMVAAAQETGDIHIDSIANLSATPIGRREETIKNLPLEKVAQLNSRWNRFTDLDEDDRRRVRRTAEAVAQQADAEFLLPTMKAYAVWLESLRPELRDKIESSDTKQRRDAIKQAIEITQVSISKRSSMKLDDETIEWIYFALRQIVRQRKESGDAATINLLERTKNRVADQDPELPTIAAIVFSGGMRGPGGRRPAMGFLRPGGDRPAPLQSDEIEMIRLVLPDRALDILDLVAGGDPLKEMMTLRYWAEETVRRKSPWQRREDSTMLERYNEMEPEQRDFVDLLLPKAILSELSRDSGRLPE